MRDARYLKISVKRALRSSRNGEGIQAAIEVLRSAGMSQADQYAFFMEMQDKEERIVSKAKNYSRRLVDAMQVTNK